MDEMQLTIIAVLASGRIPGKHQTPFTLIDMGK